MNIEHIEHQLINYIRKKFDIIDEDLSPISDLFEDGYIESVHLEKFFSGIEQKYNIYFEEDLFFEDRISTIQGIAEIIVEKKSSKKLEERQQI
jgi:acyl carrier protein